MANSNAPESSTECEYFTGQRIAAIKRWVEYIESEPPEVWGPQQNTIVNDQLEAAQHTALSASHRQRVTDIATTIIEKRDNTNGEHE